MKILYCAGTPLAGVCELMARMVGEYLPEHEARVLSKGPGKHRWYLRPGVKIKTYDVRDKRQVNEALEWAEVVHCMANVSARSFKRMDLLEKKIWVFQWHGAQIWPFEKVWLPEHFSKVRWIHIGQGWQRDSWFDRFKPFGFKIIPNIISIDDELHRPAGFGNRRPVVSFAPSNHKAKAVNTKGIPETCRALKGVEHLDLIQGATFEDCLRKKRTASLGIDEVVTPLYHRSGLEYLSQGTPCICHMDEFTERTLRDATGSSVNPFIDATKDNLREVARTFMRLPADAKEQQGQLAREWMEKYYHPKVLLQKYLAVYTSS